MTASTIRPTTAADLLALQLVLDQTGLFPSEMLPEMIAPFLAGDGDAFWLTCDVEGEAVGLCCTIAEKLADGTWNMLALAVRPDLHGKGLGTALVQTLENHLQGNGQRILIVDTSGSDGFALTRRFYAKNGYEQEARIRDFWAEGDDKVTFRKVL